MAFNEFWPRYLRAHANPKTRALHAAGTSVATLLVAAAVATRDARLAGLALVCGYGPAWFTHAFIERNRPETFSKPFSSLFADYLMTYHLLRGTLPAELERAGVSA